MICLITLLPENFLKVNFLSFYFSFFPLILAVINDFIEYDASFIMKQLLISVYYLHSIGIIHRDIKPENILITLGSNSEVKELKIIDFGFAKLVNDTHKISETCGTPNYVGIILHFLSLVNQNST